MPRTRTGTHTRNKKAGTVIAPKESETKHGGARIPVFVARIPICSLRPRALAGHHWQGALCHCLTGQDALARRCPASWCRAASSRIPICSPHAPVPCQHCFAASSARAQASLLGWVMRARGDRRRYAGDPPQPAVGGPTSHTSYIAHIVPRIHLQRSVIVPRIYILHLFVTSYIIHTLHYLHPDCLSQFGQIYILATNTRPRASSIVRATLVLAAPNTARWCFRFSNELLGS